MIPFYREVFPISSKSFQICIDLNFPTNFKPWQFYFWTFFLSFARNLQFFVIFCADFAGADYSWKSLDSLLAFFDAFLSFCAGFWFCFREWKLHAMQLSVHYLGVQDSFNRFWLIFIVFPPSLPVIYILEIAKNSLTVFVIFSFFFLSPQNSLKQNKFVDFFGKQPKNSFKK